MPQSIKSGSRSPKSRSPKPPRGKDKKKSADRLQPGASNQDGRNFPGSGSRSPSASPRSTSPIPTIQVTDLDDLDPIYDNVMPAKRYMKHHAKDIQGLY